MIKNWMVTVGLWLAKMGGWAPPVCQENHYPMGAALLESAHMLIEQVEKGFPETSGEFKRREVIRAMMNRHPEQKTRVLGMALELAFQDHD